MKKGIGMIFLSFAILGLLLIGVASADNIYLNENTSYSNVGLSVNPQFAVQVLKYEPYPVSPGESFDLWVKVQNIGQNDAQNARFSLGLDYPFSSNDSLDQSYGTIFGTLNANSNKKPGETDIQANQVVLKYHINVDDNANPGINNIKLSAYTSQSDSGITFNLPITVDKTKTDFDVELQKAGSDGYSFLVSNTGQKDANSLSVSIEPQSGLTLTGDRIFVIGNLNAGDFTKFNAPLSISNNVSNLQFKIDYTDSSGARRSIERIVSVQGISPVTSASVEVGNGYVKWIYAFVGFIIGIIAMAIVKRKQVSNLNKK